MKKHTKKGVQKYSFDEYKKKFSSPSTDRKKRTEIKPFDRGVKLAEEILTKVRNQIQGT